MTHDDTLQSFPPSNKKNWYSQERWKVHMSQLQENHNVFVFARFFHKYAMVSLMHIFPSEAETGHQHQDIDGQWSSHKNLSEHRNTSKTAELDGFSTLLDTSRTWFRRCRPWGSMEQHLTQVQANLLRKPLLEPVAAATDSPQKPIQLIRWWYKLNWFPTMVEKTNWSSDQSNIGDGISKKNVWGSQTLRESYIKVTSSVSHRKGWEKSISWNPSRSQCHTPMQVDLKASACISNLVTWLQASGIALMSWLPWRRCDVLECSPGGKDGLCDCALKDV